MGYNSWGEVLIPQVGNMRQDILDLDLLKHGSIILLITCIVVSFVCFFSHLACPFGIIIT